MNLRKFIADKKFYKHVIMIAVPLMLQQFVNASVNLVDNLMVGQLGDASLAGVASVNRVYIIVLFAITGFMSTTAVFIAQFYGAKDNERIKQSFRFGIVFCTIIAVVFTGISLAIPELLVSFFTDEPLIITEGIKYFKYFALSIIPLVFCLVLSDAMRAVGDVKTPMYAAIFAVLCNCLFNYVLIFGHFGFPEMGVAGAGLATFLSRALEAILLFYVLYKKDFPFKTKISDLFKIDKSLANKIVVKALPLASNEIVWSIGMATLFKFYSTRGGEVMSGYAITGTVSDLFFTLFGGMAAATTVIISQKLGANKLEEARNNSYQMIGFSVMLSVCLGVLLYITSFIIPTWFNVSPIALETAQSFLRVQSVFFWVYMLSAQSYFILRAGGDTKSVLMLDSGYMWCINIPVVFMVTYFTSYPIIVLYICGQITDLLKVFIAYRLVDKGNWVRNLTHIQDA